MRYIINKVCDDCDDWDQNNIEREIIKLDANIAEQGFLNYYFW